MCAPQNNSVSRKIVTPLCWFNHPTWFKCELQIRHIFETGAFRLERWWTAALLSKAVNSSKVDAEASSRGESLPWMVPSVWITEQNVLYDLREKKHNFGLAWAVDKNCPILCQCTSNASDEVNFHPLKMAMQTHFILFCHQSVILWLMTFSVLEGQSSILESEKQSNRVLFLRPIFMTVSG